MRTKLNYGLRCSYPTRLLPYCFGTYVVLFKSYAKNFRLWIHHFFKSLHSMSPMSFEFMFLFKFWANLTSKNVSGKLGCSSLLCSLASGFNNQKFTINVINFLMPCLISVILLILISSIFLQMLVYGLLQKYLWKHVNQLCLHSPSVIMWFKT